MPKNLIRWSEIILVIFLALALADFAWLLLPEPGRDDNRASLSSLPSSHAAPTAPESNNMARRLSPALLSLFGQPVNFTDAPAFRGDDIKETELDLALKGILASRSGSRKLALIALGDEKENVYRIGNRIAGAEITHIEARRIILERNGVRETLTLETAEPRRGNSFAGRRVTAGITMINERERVVSRNLLERQMQRLPEVLNQAAAVPYWDNNGHEAGFRVVDIADGSVFERLGLQQEDVIVSVNGVSVRNNREALAAYQSFKSADALQIGLLRNGQEVTVDFSIQ